MSIPVLVVSLRCLDDQLCLLPGTIKILPKIMIRICATKRRARYVQTHTQEQFPIRALDISTRLDGAGEQFSAMIPFSSPV